MNPARSSLYDLDKSLKPLFGELCWKVEWCNLTNLDLCFGLPRVRVLREPRKSSSSDAEVRRIAHRRLVSVSGYWSLWVYQAHWRIVQSGECLATGSASYRKKFNAMQELRGQRLVSAELDTGTGATSFQFDLDTLLDVRRLNRQSKDELWILRGRDGFVRSAYGDGSFRRKKWDP